MKKFYFSAINLGCSKNLVDLEFVMGNIFDFSQKIDIKFFTNPDEDEVEYLIINTCGFLSSSRKEAENVIKEYDNKGKKIIIMGCYLEVKDDRFLLNLKNLYAIIPHNDSKNIGAIFKSTFDESIKDRLSSIKQNRLEEFLKNIGGNNISSKAFIWEGSNTRAYLNASYGYEYLKISEGCDNNCTFCIIPNIRGRQKSRTMEDIISEVKTMVSLGIKEIQIIAQDSVRYGMDIYGESKIADLLEKIDEVEGDFKYRIYYLYPDNLTFSCLKRFTKLKKMLPYFDIPFQHISPRILKLMGRFYDEEHIYKLIDFIKINFKGAFIHTNFIIGFPSEEEKDFEKLKNFIKKYKFDSVSVFGYHDEKLAASSKLGNKVSDKIIRERVSKLKEILGEIYNEKYKKRAKKIQTGYIHKISGDKLLVRPEIHAPEIDELDYIKKNQILKGDIGIGEKIKYKLALVV